MDEQQTPTEPTNNAGPAQRPGVMDVQRPVSATPTAPTVNSPTPSPAQPEGMATVTEENTTAPVVTEAPQEDTGAIAEAPIPEQEPEEEETPAPLLAAQPNTKPKTSKLVVLVTLLVAVALIGLSVFAYVKSQDHTDYDASNTQSIEHSPTESTEQPATTEDVDAASKEVDDTMKELDNTTNLSEEALTDEELQLQ